MPSTYAHYAFGRQFLRHLDERRKDWSRRICHIVIGLHGPDILFYYRPLTPILVSRLGHALHGGTAAGFWKGREKCSRGPGADPRAYTRWDFYAIMLDASVILYKGKGKPPGCCTEIETEFDGCLWKRTGLPLFHGRGICAKARLRGLRRGVL
jgi:hypothetical protein